MWLSYISSFDKILKIYSSPFVNMLMMLFSVLRQAFDYLHQLIFLFFLRNLSASLLYDRRVFCQNFYFQSQAFFEWVENSHSLFFIAALWSCKTLPSFNWFAFALICKNEYFFGVLLSIIGFIVLSRCICLHCTSYLCILSIILFDALVFHILFYLFKAYAEKIWNHL